MIVQCRAAAALREREQAPPLSVLQIFRSVVDDPVARATPAPADIIDRPSSNVAPKPTANNNPLKRKGDVDQQPYSRLEPVGLLGAARSHSSLESARASRARVRAASAVNAAHCQCCRFSDLLSMPPWLAQRRRQPTSSIARAPSSPRTRLPTTIRQKERATSTSSRTAGSG